MKTNNLTPAQKADLILDEIRLRQEPSEQDLKTQNELQEVIEQFGFGDWSFPDLLQGAMAYGRCIEKQTHFMGLGGDDRVRTDIPDLDDDLLGTLKVFGFYMTGERYHKETWQDRYRRWLYSTHPNPDAGILKFIEVDGDEQ